MSDELGSNEGRQDHANFYPKNAIMGVLDKKSAVERSQYYCQINQVVKERVGGNGSHFWNICTCANSGPGVRK